MPSARIVTSAGRRFRDAVASTLAVILAATMLLAAASPATADTAVPVPTLSKTAQASTGPQGELARVGAGESVTFRLVFGCSVTVCAQARVTDEVPAELEVISVTSTEGVVQPWTTNAGTGGVTPLTVTLGDFASGGGGTVTVLARFRDQAPGTHGPVVNTAAMSTVHPVDLTPITATDTAAVTGVFPAAPSATATKVWGASTSGQSGADELAAPGAAKALTLSAVNTSNIALDTITISEPVNPAASTAPPGSAFDLLDLAATAPQVTWPDGATSVTVTSFQGPTPSAPATFTRGQAVAWPAGIAPADVTGFRFEFAGTFRVTGSTADRTASVGVELAQRATSRAGAPIPPATHTAVTVSNQIGVDLAGDDPVSPGTVARVSALSPVASFQIVRPVWIATAAKSVTPATIALGGETAVFTVTGRNASNQSVTSLTFSDPAAGSTTGLLGGDVLEFAGFTALSWPAWATGATLHVAYASAPAAVFSVADAAGLIALTGLAGLTGFELVLEGDVPQGASVALSYRVRPAATAAAAPGGVVNCVAATAATTDGADVVGTDTSDPACATLRVVAPVLGVTAGKRLSQTSVSTAPGSTVIAGLTATVSGGNVQPTTLAVQDPAVFGGAEKAWWDVMQPTGLKLTMVPAETTLTVYATTDGTTWSPVLTRHGGTTGLLVDEAFSGDPSTWQGVRAEMTRDTGLHFAANGSIQVNLGFEVRSGAAFAHGAVLTNCVTATADRPGAAQATSRLATCPTVKGVALGAGQPAPLTKTMTGDALEGAATQVTALLQWNTGLLGGSLDEVTVSDHNPTPGEEERPLEGAGSFWESFDVVGVGPITSGAASVGTTAYDPYLVFDEVVDVQYFDTVTDTWKTASNVASVCKGGACVGAFPGLNLTVAERAVAGGIRLVYAERADRAAQLAALVAGGDPRVLVAPAVGSGVATVAPGTGSPRQVKVTAVLRDTLRSTVTPTYRGDPVNDALDYNGSKHGNVVNDGWISGPTTSGPALGGSASSLPSERDVTILPATLTPGATKAWSRGEVGIPSTEAGPYPTSRLTLTGTNSSGMRVDSMTVTEPAATPDAATAPFSSFTITKITSISTPTSTPAGTTVEVRLTRAGAAHATTYSLAQALALTPTDLADVVQVQVAYAGRIDSGQVATVILDTELRARNRVTGDPIVSALTVDNTVSASLTDARVCTATGVPAVEDAVSCTPQVVTALASAPIAVASKSLTVSTTKVISPSTLDRDTRGPVSATLEVWNIGNTASDGLALVDTAVTDGAAPQGITVQGSATFYDAVDLSGVTVARVPSVSGGAVTVRLDVHHGASFAAAGTPSAVDGGTLTATGGAWTNGVARPAVLNGALPLPAGVSSWADVDGVRVTFLAASGQKLTTPSSSSARVTMRGNVRATLRSSGVAPSATSTANVPADAAPNPGESVVGRVSNGFTGYAQADDTASPNAVFTSAPHSSAAAFGVLAGAMRVAVSKGVEGSSTTFNPGQSATFTLQFTNTGTADVIDPVVTDVLPLRNGREQLVLDTAATHAAPATGSRPWSLTGTSLPATGGAMAYDAATHRITFTWPAGSVIRPGEVGTIRLPLQIAAGAEAGVSIRNTFGLSTASSTRRLTAATCTGTFGSAALPAASCSATRDVGVNTYDTFTATKGVRTDGTFVTSTGPTTTCTPAADGMSRSSACVAVTTPGGSIAWQARVTNTGNVDGTKLSMIDTLPHPGDSYLTPGGQLRGSTWAPVWDGVMPTLTYTLADGAQLGAADGVALTTYYSTRNDGGVVPADYDVIDPRVWSLLDPGVDPATVRSLRFVVTLPSVNGQRLMVPLASATVSWSMTAPTQIDATAGATAWNSFRYQVTPVGGMARQLEPDKVGVLFPHRPLTVVKTVDQSALDPAYQVDRSYEVLVACTVPTPAGTAALMLPAGGVLTLDAAGSYRAQVASVPDGASCTVTETGAAGATGVEYGTADPGRPLAAQPVTVLVGGTGPDADTLRVHNTFEATSLSVSKVVDARSKAPASQTYDVTLVCTSAGTPLALPAADAAFTLTAGGSRTVTDLPVGAECIVTETRSHGALIGYRVGTSATVSTTGTVTLAGASNQVAIENAFSALELTKEVGAASVLRGQQLDYTLGVANTGPAATADVRLVDTLPTEVRVVQVDAPAPWTCAATGADADGYGGSLACAYPAGSRLAPGASAPVVRVTVEVRPDVAVDGFVNSAVVRWTDTGSPNPTPTEREDPDEARVTVLRLTAQAAPACVADARWLTYDVELHTIDASSTPVTFTWFADADRDGVPDGAALHVDTVPAGGDLSGRLLWPGTTLDADGVATGWPGMRVVRAGETPTWLNLVTDPALPEAALTGGVLVRVDAVDSALLSAVYPAAGSGCMLPRAARFALGKTASSSRVGTSADLDYTLAVRSTGRGASGDVTVRDRVPSALTVVGVSTAAPADATTPAWQECTVTERDAQGNGGLVTCVLAGWLGAEQHAPDVTVAVQVAPGASGSVVNTASVGWTDGSDPSSSEVLASDSAEVTVSSLATTGVFAAGLALLAALLVGAGAFVLVWRRRAV
ncbi:DUF5979 domain-containing protein [Cellulomonas sp. P22]|uniref:DUF5979 domain-containing protein n=1 Tax=Cellulomonas sp. P22 TaxID=3373189 RepID=UPI00379BFF10